ncbi:MAG: DUF5615 family PIN-like protein [Cyanobacteria bacterium J06643_4]
MAALYSDEGFPIKVSELLSELGHDVLTVQAAGNANQGISDDAVLAFSVKYNRAVLTVNLADFIKLHKQSSEHAGIIVCSEDLNRQGLAERIHAVISQVGSLRGRLVRVNRPA